MTVFIDSAWTETRAEPGEPCRGDDTTGASDFSTCVTNYASRPGTSNVVNTCEESAQLVIARQASGVGAHGQQQ